MNSANVLIIDDNIANLKIAEKILEPYYKTTLLTSGAQASKYLSKHRPDVILLDMYMPDMDGFETLKMIKEQPDVCDIPVIMLSTIHDTEKEVLGLSLGVCDFIYKPFIPEVLLNHVRIHVETEKYKRIALEITSKEANVSERLQDALLISIAEMMETKYEMIEGHMRRTGKYLEILTSALLSARKAYSEKLTDRYVSCILRSVPLYDIGKIGISEDALSKIASPDDKKKEEMRLHTLIGAAALQKAMDRVEGDEFLSVARDIALSHHEKWDGTGLPQGLKGEKIPVAARIVSIVDTYDALTSCNSLKHKEACNYITAHSGDMFDPVIVKVFEKCSSEFKRALEEF